MRNPYHKSMHRSRVIPVFECIVPTFCQILKIAKALDFTAFQRFNRPIGRTIAEPGTSWRPVLLCVMASWRSMLSSRSVLSAACLAVCVRFISVLFSRESRDCSLTISVQAGSLRLELKVELGISCRLVRIRKDYI